MSKSNEVRKGDPTAKELPVINNSKIRESPFEESNSFPSKRIKCNMSAATAVAKSRSPSPNKRSKPSSPVAPKREEEDNISTYPMHVDLSGGDELFAFAPNDAIQNFPFKNNNNNHASGVPPNIIVTKLHRFYDNNHVSNNAPEKPSPPTSAPTSPSPLRKKRIKEESSFPENRVRIDGGGGPVLLSPSKKFEAGIYFPERIKKGKDTKSSPNDLSLSNDDDVAIQDALNAIRGFSQVEKDSDAESVESVSRAQNYYVSISNMEIKTGMEAVAFFIKEGSASPIKFVYLEHAKNSYEYNPYDLRVVPLDKVANEYYIMTARGLTHMIDKVTSDFQTSTTSLDSFVQEAHNFHKLQSLKTFQGFLIWKMFGNWRKNIRYSIYCKNRYKMSQKLFFNFPNFCKVLLNVNENLSQIWAQPLLDLDFHRTCELEEFQEKEKSHFVHVSNNIEKVFEKNQEVISLMCNEVAANAKKLELVDPVMESNHNMKNVSMAQARIEKVERMKALRKAMVEQSLRGDFIRLVDYLTVSTLVSHALSTLEKLYYFMLNAPSVLNKVGWFRTSILFDDSGKNVFSPDVKELYNTMYKVIDKMIATVDGSQRILYTLTLDKTPIPTAGPAELLDGSERYTSLMQSIQKKMFDDFQHAESYSSNFDRFHIIDEYGKSFDVEHFKQQPHDFNTLKSELLKVFPWEGDLDRMYVSRTVGTILVVESRKLKKKIQERLPVILDCIKDMLLHMARAQCTSLTAEYNSHIVTLDLKGDKLGKFADCVKNLKNAKDAIEDLKTRFQSVNKVYTTLSQYKVSIPHDDLVLSDEMREKKDSFILKTKASEMYVTEEMGGYLKDLDRNTAQLDSQYKQILDSLYESPFIDASQDPQDVVAELERAKVRIEGFDERAVVLSNYQVLFGGGPINFESSVKLKPVFDIQYHLWTSYASWIKMLEEWSSNDFRNLMNPPDERYGELGYGPILEKKVDEVYAIARQVEKDIKLADYNAALDVSNKFKINVSTFKKRAGMVAMLGSPAIKHRHWKLIFKILNENLEDDASFSLSNLVELKLFSEDKYSDAVEGVAGSATKEWSFEKTLTRMRDDWKGINFTFIPYQDSGTYILSAIDEISMQLDDQIVKIQTMKGSPFARPFATEVAEWENILNTTQTVLNEWLKVQVNYLYLAPIFSSADIVSQMPEEARFFTDVDRSWRKNALFAVNNPEVLTVGMREGLVDILKTQNNYLDKIQKGLAKYLETKRLFFPRFYFLANDELLEILSETADPRRVQKFLKKCFEGINYLEFTKKLDIMSMQSPEGESVPFNQNGESPINPHDSAGSVEVWLDKVESMMRSSIFETIRKGMEAYPKGKREKWVTEWPGQVVLCVSQIFWTLEVQSHIASNGKSGIAAYETVCNKQLANIVEMVRSNLTPLQRLTCAALVVIDVHARDVLFKIKDTVENVFDFDWMAQLRYYWEREATNNFKSTNGAVKAKMINAVLDYAYEYLGNSGRLVITPLTDRCYRTLMGAIHLGLGGAPEGPAGTGKTETTKDLGKAIAMQCVVYNCSDQLDYLDMGKFFKGLIGSGAWACFDEFNRINIEVLSVVAQQIMTIQHNKVLKSESFMFEGTNIRLVLSCNVFITMNPGYAGRSSLPDNLKVLFRSVAMMVPDYALIAEITLYSYGYLEARIMSNKIVTLYRLCSEQLSSQDHYDCGMRAVVAVLRAAGNLKRKFVDYPEANLILRAIKDVNEPKFLAIDTELFKGIVSDLFPGVNVKDSDNASMNEALINNCQKYSLQPANNFLLKCLQLYEMILVRHGLMLVGNPFSGKTCTWRVLAGALTDLGKERKLNETPVQVVPINPKSITMGQLYGEYDKVSKEWKDGVLSVRYRELAQNKIGEAKDRKWVLLDGPVDAIWIENMNTVLDDNKKLCLISGEIIQMPIEMNMIFEVMDLSVASPATVSRVGIVYMEPSMLGWKPLFTSWLKTLPIRISANNHNFHIEALFDWLVDPAIRFVKKEITEACLSIETNLVKSCMEIISCFFNIAGASLIDNEVSEVEIRSRIDAIFLFAIVWSIGVTGNYAGRVKFDAYLRNIIANGLSEDGTPLLSRPFPEGGSIYDYCLNLSDFMWLTWVETLPLQEIGPEMSFHEITVQTKDTAQLFFIANTCIKNSTKLLVVGPTGTGKSAYIHKVLNEQLNPEIYIPVGINFSAQTSAKLTQSQIDLNVDKRRKGNLMYSSTIYGPPVDHKLVIFVDDLNMPKIETFGAQPPIELLRQFMDYDGWYDLNDNSFRQMQDVYFICAMGPPGGGRNHITPRFQRHFLVLNVTEFDDIALNKIFMTILDWHFSAPGISSSVRAMSKSIVNASISVYHKAAIDLLPTPMKSHYLFNLRDLSRVIQGMLLVERSQLSQGRVGEIELQRLWFHEVLRVFHDRLVDVDEQTRFIDYLKSTLNSHFKTNADELFINLLPESDSGGSSGGKSINSNHLRSLIWGDFFNPKSPLKLYEESNDIHQVLEVVDKQLEEYNNDSRNKMDLVIFLFAVEHIARISRILKTPGANCLLVGVGGSGRKSLTILASYMSSSKVYQIEITKNYSMSDWKEDIKNVLRLASSGKDHVVFLFSDTQIKSETYVEDINSILNAGEVPNLFALDEKTSVLEMIRTSIAKAKGNAKADKLMATDLYNEFKARIKINLHIVLCFSPVGNAFRARLRSFPSLINCCTIDWFQSWPDDALVGVAKKFLSKIEMSDKNRSSSVSMCRHFHQSVIFLSTDFQSQLKRYNYVTPTSFLELLKSFDFLLALKTKAVSKLKERYDVGLQKISSTKVAVGSMQKELEDLQPILKKTQVETTQLMEKIAVRVPEVDSMKNKVRGEAIIASEKAEEARKISEECEHSLAEAIPLLNSAIEALECLRPGDINEIKVMANPPEGVKFIMKSICVMLNKPPAKKKDPAGSTKKIDDWWTPSKELLSLKDFITILKEFDKDNIDFRIMKKIREEFTADETFTPEKARSYSAACEGLCRWVIAMDMYDKVAKDVAPKRAKLAEAQSDFDIVNAQLQAKQKELKIVEEEMALLEMQLNAAVKRSFSLTAQTRDCEVKLIRAQQLIQSLGSEEERWTINSRELGEVLDNLLADVLLSSGYVAYLGAFTPSFRAAIKADWIEKSAQLGLICSDNFSLGITLGDPVLIREWKIQGLPSDGFSVDNALIVKNARRWPLLIDPQGQANKWIRTMESNSNIKIVKQTDSNFLKVLELSIYNGNPVLLENVPDELDPALEPLLLKQIFKDKGVLLIRLGDTNIEFNENFRFYMTTNLRNPHYLPETAVKVSLINFMITQDGLQDQMLGIAVKEERPDLEVKRNELILQSAENKRALKEIEEKILEILSTSEGDILNDESAINVLSSSKLLANEIASKQKIADITELEINETRKEYVPVASHTSSLFFCITDLAAIDPMYQYSLAWFIRIFIRSIHESEKSSLLSHRIVILNHHFEYSLYKNICRSLFEKDKLTFSFLMCMKIESSNNRINSDELRFLMTGGVSLGAPVDPNPAPKWLPDKSWGEIARFSNLEVFADFASDFTNEINEWEKVYDSTAPQLCEFPPSFSKRSLSSFHRLLILRMIRPDKVIPAIVAYVTEKMGSAFVEPPPFDLKLCYSDSGVKQPLIFILSPGSDPSSELLRFANNEKMFVDTISLGQGQGDRAADKIIKAVERGDWVLLQNCHLAVSWMTTLESIVENIDLAKANKDFRLWLTSYPSPDFPVSILQNGVKMTNEPPAGIRANIYRSYTTDPLSEPSYLESCDAMKKGNIFKTLVYTLCFFHALVQERRNFGPLGWIIPYEFNNSDLSISIKQLCMFLQEQDVVPWEALVYCTGECNYGGRVTDEHDRRTLNAILTDLYNASVLTNNYSLSPSGKYVVPAVGNYDSYLEFTKSLPQEQLPEIFGMDLNADISKDQQATQSMFDACIISGVLEGQSSGKRAGKGSDETISDIAKGILLNLPNLFNIEHIQNKFPVDYNECFNIVIVQECLRYNRLIAIVSDSMEKIIKAIKGLVVMSSDLEAVGVSLLNGQVPKLWRGKSYPSLKPLGSYVAHLLSRLNMMQTWVNVGKPDIFWISGFFFTHGFCTAAKQNFARKYKIAIDEVEFDFEVQNKTFDEIKSKPEDGVYVYGIFLEGARWNATSRTLCDQQPKQLVCEMPVMWIKTISKNKVIKYKHYNCPLYREASRNGTLTTTGHSTNFVMDIKLPINESDTPKKWIKCGSAMLLELSF